MDLEYISSLIKLILAFQANFEIKWIIILRYEKNDDALQLSEIIASGLQKAPNFFYVSAHDFETFVELCNFELLHESTMVFSLIPESAELQGWFWDEIKFKMPHFIWLIATQDLKYFSPIYVPFDCQFFLIPKNNNLFNIFEFYNAEASFWTLFFGSWTDENGLKIDEKSFDVRRDNLTGYELVVYHEKDLPDDWFSVTANIIYWEAMVDIGNRLHTKIGYTYDIEGIYEVNIVPNRIIPGQSVSPIFIFRYDLYFRITTRTFSWNTYFKPFTSIFWAAIAATSSCWWISLFCVYKFLRYVHRLPTTKNQKKISVMSLIDLDTESGKSPTYNSATIIFFISIISRIILSNAYSATFMSFVIVFISKPPFTDLAGIVENGNYKILAIPTRSYVFYELFVEDPVIKALHERFVIPKEKQVTNYDDAFKKLCYSGKNYVTDFPAKLIKEMKLKMKDCIISDTSIKLIYGEGTWMSKENSPFRRTVSYWSLRLVEAGTMDPMVWSRSSSLRQFNVGNITRPIDIYDSALLFIILSIGVWMSLIVLQIEKIHKKLTKNFYRKSRLIYIAKKRKGRPFQN